MRPDDLPKEWLARTSKAVLSDSGDVLSVEFLPDGHPLDVGYPYFREEQAIRAAADRLDREWQQGNLDVVVEVGLILDELQADQLNKGAAQGFLVALFNKHVDQSTRRVRCEAVIVAPGGVKGEGIGPVVGYSLAGRLFGLDGRPFVNSPVEYTLIKVDG